MQTPRGVFLQVITDPFNPDGRLSEIDQCTSTSVGR